VKDKGLKGFSVIVGVLSGNIVLVGIGVAIDTLAICVWLCAAKAVFTITVCIMFGSVGTKEGTTLLEPQARVTKIVQAKT